MIQDIFKLNTDAKFRRKEKLFIYHEKKSLKQAKNFMLWDDESRTQWKFLNDLGSVFS